MDWTDASRVATMACLHVQGQCSHACSERVSNNIQELAPIDAAEGVLVQQHPLLNRGLGTEASVTAGRSLRQRKCLGVSLIHAAGPAKSRGPDARLG